MTGRVLAARLGPVGVWSPHLQWQPFARAREAVAELEELGFGAVWIGEATGKEVMTNAALLLGGASRITVATGIASIWGRDPMAMANAARTLSEAYPSRFVLGLGVSHPFLNEHRDKEYARPLSAMREYLSTMDAAPWAGPPAEAPPRVLAALGPKMLELARDRAAGAFPYFVPVEHTEIARTILGPSPLLATEQAVVFETDPSEARRLARTYMATYLRLANYSNNLKRLGWSDDDLADGGSDALVDGLVGWGDDEQIADRIRSHLDAGADHVPVRILTPDPKVLPSDLHRRLADLLPMLER